MFALETLSISALAAIAVPFIGALIIALTKRSSAKYIAILFAFVSLAASLFNSYVYFANGKAVTTFNYLSLGDANLIGFIFDNLSTLLAPAFVGIGLLVLIYAKGYLNEKNREHADVGHKRFYALFLVFIGAMAGLAYSSTILSQLIFFEITGACSWGLIGYYQSDAAHSSSDKALIVTHIASLGMFLASAVLFIMTGTFELTALSQIEGPWKIFVLLCIMFAAWGKSAQLPLYMWLPSAMTAPTPVSAYLHGGSMVKVGVYVYARAIYSAGSIPESVAWVGIIGAIITLVFSFIEYLPQKDMKRLLAFSTISQLSYIFLALSVAALAVAQGQGLQEGAAQMAFNGGVSHIFNHAFAKTLFFLVAGTIAFTVGMRDLTRMGGLIKKMPIVGVAFVCAALAVAGVPPFSGFFSKFQIFAGGFLVAQNSWLLLLIMIVALIETLACFAWFLMWINRAVLGEPSKEIASAQDVPGEIKFVLGVLIVMTVVSSFMAAAWLG